LKTEKDLKYETGNVSHFSEAVCVKTCARILPECNLTLETKTSQSSLLDFQHKAGPF